MARKRRNKDKKPAIAIKQALEARAKRARQQVAPTANARIIRDLMYTQDMRGNYKDYVILAGKRLIDWQDSYDMVTEDGKTVGVKSMAIVHKSKLAAIVGAELAGHFWRPGIGRVDTRRRKGNGHGHGTPE